MTDIQERLAAAFQAEHREHLQAVRAMLDDVARRGFDARAFDFVEAYRRVHSLKGAARAVGLPAIERLAHRLETVVERCHTGGLTLDATVADAIGRAFDEIEDWAATLADSSATPSGNAGLAALDRVLDVAPATTADGPPAAEATEAPAARRGVDHVEETVRVNVEALDAVLRQSGEIVSETSRQERIADELRRLRRELGARRAAAAQAGPAGDHSLDDILDRLKELNDVQIDAAWRLRKLGSQLHHDVRDLRIVPAESVFGGFRKMIRDLARDNGKDVAVEVDGLDMLVDRNILQRLRDPVLHLLRNAISHGIETPQQRLAGGKQAAGRVGLRLSSHRGRLAIIVEDDGGGLDRERIAAEAERRGLPSGDLADVLVQPGFSTAENLTEISGRGIGLSIVDKAVRLMRGAFEIAARTPHGTVATITVPLSISGERVLTVSCDGQTYCVPAYAIERVRRVAASEISTIAGAPFIAAVGDGEKVPLSDLARLLGRVGAPRSDDGGGPVPIVSLRIDEARLALVVDGFGGVDDVVVHDLEPAVAGPRLADGSVVLRDGAAAFLLNPRELIRAAGEAHQDDTFEPAPAAPRRAVSDILVVDDSITTRTLEKSILEATGYRVRLSTDGVDALEQLRQRPADLVIADIEMPRMDGFGLLHAVRGDPQLRSIPVILVTSRADPEDRHKGLALGAQAYIIKQRFDQRDLLAAIEQIL
ncbi:MAG: response regulator [Reyranellaceae bacterium]